MNFVLESLQTDLKKCIEERFPMQVRAVAQSGLPNV